MSPSARSIPIIVVLAAAVFIAGHRPAAAGVARSDTGDVLRQVQSLAGETLRRLSDWLDIGYSQRPALMIGLAATLLLPILAVMGLIIHRAPRDQQAQPADETGPSVLGQAARLELDGKRTVQLPMSRDLLQIGRQHDNDISIADDSVHRYHAIIERTPDFSYTITDISGPDGNGLVVNGQRCRSAALAHGDMIEIGNARMRFASMA